jgi:hypothetical protein
LVDGVVVYALPYASLFIEEVEGVEASVCRRRDMRTFLLRLKLVCDLGVRSLLFLMVSNYGAKRGCRMGFDDGDVCLCYRFYILVMYCGCRSCVLEVHLYYDSYNWPHSDLDWRRRCNMGF